MHHMQRRMYATLKPALLGSLHCNALELREWGRPSDYCIPIFRKSLVKGMGDADAMLKLGDMH